MFKRQEKSGWKFVNFGVRENLRSLKNEKIVGNSDCESIRRMGSMEIYEIIRDAEIGRDRLSAKM